MARIRTIKPEFWDDEKIASLSYPCRLFFIGTWTQADDNGVIRGSAAILKSKIFPYDDNLRVNEVQKWIDALVKARMLVPVSYNGESYYVIRTFHSHQKFDARYPNYLIDKEEFKTVYPPDVSPSSTQRVPNEYPPREGEREEGKGNNTPLSPNGDIPPSGGAVPKNPETPFEKLSAKIRKELPNVAKLPQQLTEEQLNSLMQKYNRGEIWDILCDMDNTTGLCKKYRNVGRTAYNWLKFRNNERK
jgi:hypothetical protein